MVGGIRSLVEQAMLAPSVHNVQPARWRIEDGAALLLEEAGRRLAVADPRGNDAAISLGAAAEGLRLAASRDGLSAVAETDALPKPAGGLRPVARYRFVPGAEADPLASLVDARRSWRGAFERPTPADRAAALALAGEDAAVCADADALREMARRFDRASYGFMRDPAFRRELVSWMRLSRRHPRWSADGLNAEAMAMGRIEALGAGVVLGPAFRPLDRIGLAPALLAEGSKVAGSAALVVFHRPEAEDPFVSGGHFYRLWLRLEAAGFGAAVLAALADDPDAAREVADLTGIPAGRRVVSAFRIGRRPPRAQAPRARRPIEEVLVEGGQAG
ncbi:MAG: hypothetical protein JOZ90_09240 [Alphaproteobacteria bacterium]|nr:hypothetical protein [Alphaproteobacteria bacterium]MBV9372368.1 hypothetical protein [Alphaproteobacteria bacterium]MBV9901268.1 hypothetical protein [Alphaproteobacteria bacterium]